MMTQANSKVENNLIDLLCCLSCGGLLSKNGADVVLCMACGGRYPVLNGKVFLTSPESTSLVTDPLDQIKTYFKKFYSIYPLLVQIISPVFPITTIRLRKKIRTHGAGKVILNLGSGTTDLGKNVVNVDMMPYVPVDVVTTLEKLPFQNEKVDWILSVAVLEHVRDPQSAVCEMKRVLKKGGQISCFIPFVQGFHASPHDYQRYTSEGIKELFKGFQINSVTAVGPTSGFLWIAQEWLALLFSFGSLRLYRALHLSLLVTTFPLKFLDLLLSAHPAAKNIATGFFIECTKE